MKTVDKIQIAEEMMTAAIVEYRDHYRHFAAINLAGVAEELYGKLLRISGKKTFRDEIIKSVLDDEKDDFLDIKTMRKAVNLCKNAIKHMDSVNDRFIRLNAREQAIHAINEAMQNRDRLSLPPNKFLDQFCEDAKQFHKRNNPNS